MPQKPISPPNVHVIGPRTVSEVGKNLVIDAGLDFVRLEVLRKRNRAKITGNVEAERAKQFKSFEEKRKKRFDATNTFKERDKASTGLIPSIHTIYLYDYDYFYGTNTEILPPGLTYVQAKFVPSELHYSVGVNLAKIQSPGRNNPHYHYLGAEDTLSLTLDWHTNDPNRYDVTLYTRWLEMMAKVDGNSRAVKKRLGIYWAASKSNDFKTNPTQYAQLFLHSAWLIESIDTKYSLFHKGYNMLPTQAFQELKLVKAVERNQTFKDIIGQDL